VVASSELDGWSLVGWSSDVMEQDDLKVSSVLLTSFSSALVVGDTALEPARVSTEVGVPRVSLLAFESGFVDIASSDSNPFITSTSGVISVTS
jgi:hypothetical protein